MPTSPSNSDDEGNAQEGRESPDNHEDEPEWENDSGDEEQPHADDFDSDSAPQSGFEDDSDPEEEENIPYNNDEDASSDNEEEGNANGDAITAPSSGDEHSEETPEAPFVYPAADEEHEAGFDDEDPLLAKASDEEGEAEEGEAPKSVGDQHDPMIKPLICCIIVASLVAAIIFPILFLVVLPNHHDKDQKDPPPPTTLAPTTPAPTPVEWVLELPQEWKTEIDNDPTSAMAQAYQWVKDDPKLRSYPPARRNQRFALAGLYFGAGGVSWTRQGQWLSYLTAECWWDGVACDNSGDATRTPMTIVPNVTATMAPTNATMEEPTTNSSNIFQQTNRVYLRRQLQQPPTKPPTFPPAKPPTNAPATRALKPFDRVKLLNLADIQMKGTLAKEFSFLTDLQYLDLRNNGILGSIPLAWFESFPNLLEFNLANNSLTGTLPSSIANWANLTLLDVSQNQQLTHTIPSQLGLLSALYWLDVSHNRMTGLPSELSQLGLLQRLGVRDNALNQTLPAQYGDLTSLQALDAGENNLQGRIPPRLGDLSQLQILLLDHNNLSGPVPNTIGPPGGQNSLKQFHIDENPLLTGVLPQRLCFIDLNFTCVVPHESNSLCGCACSCDADGTGGPLMPPGDLSVPEEPPATTVPTTTAPVSNDNTTTAGMMENATTATPDVGVGTASPTSSGNETAEAIVPEEAECTPSGDEICPVADCSAPPDGCDYIDYHYVTNNAGDCCPSLCYAVDSNGDRCN